MGKEERAQERSKDRSRTFRWMLVPILILFFVFNTVPLIQGFVYSFTNFKGYGSFEWVGLRNYADLFTDGRVGNSSPSSWPSSRPSS